MIKDLTAEALEVLTTLPPYTENNIFTLNKELRNAGFNAEITAEILTQLRLRTKANTKFGNYAHKLLYTSTGLEQATPLILSKIHAQRFSSCASKHLIDFGCGIGTDTLAFSQQGLTVTAIELDPNTALAAHHNLKDFPKTTVINADGFTSDLSQADAIWLDPARRNNGKRISNPQKWKPSLAEAITLGHKFDAAGIKIAPGIDYKDLPTNAHVQWASIDGNLVEAVIWLGKAMPATGRSALVINTNLAAPIIFTSNTTNPQTPSPDVPPRQLGTYLYEPDPAIIRSGTIQEICAQFDLAPVSARIAYLSSNKKIDSPLLTRFTIQDILPYNTKIVRKTLHEKEIGKIEIKKRGLDLTPEQYRKTLKLNLKMPNSATLIITPILGKKQVIIAKREPN